MPAAALGAECSTTTSVAITAQQSLVGPKQETKLVEIALLAQSIGVGDQQASTAGALDDSAGTSIPTKASSNRVEVRVDADRGGSCHRVWIGVRVQALVISVTLTLYYAQQQGVIV